MKNRAKCRLCQSVIESFHSTDYVMCKCGEIAVDAGSAMKCFAQSWENFIRVDDNNNEIVVKVQQSPSDTTLNDKTLSNKPTIDDLLDMLDEMTKSIERLPQQAMTLPITHYDHYSSLMLILSCLRALKSR